MRNFQDTFETRKRSFISTLSICMTPVGINLLKVNNRNTRNAVFIVNFEHISHLALVFLLLTLNK